jgi:hypothetical protein
MTMNSFELDADELRSVRADLVRLREDLAGHLRTADELIESVPKSGQPVPNRVANRMHRVYRDSETDVRDALVDYLEELDDLTALIDATVEAYTAADNNSAARHRATSPGVS